MRRGAKVFPLWGCALALTVALIPSAARPQEAGKGNLVGFVYERDGSIPVEGAVIVVKNLTTGFVSESPGSDGLGAFKVLGLESGIYALGVRSAKGSYNSQDLFGVTAGKTAKISISLDAYDKKAAADAEAVIKEQRDKGEAFIGKVVDYDPQTKRAEIFVEIGLIQSVDRIHVKGQVTDFYQDTKALNARGIRVERILSGASGHFQASKPCVQGDFVYIVCRQGIPPFFLAPLGIAAIVAGAVPLSAIYKEDASPYRIKR
jgi:hypothetical protein